MESPAAWATFRPAACTLGLAGICFSVIHSTHCAAEQLAFVFFRSPLFTLFTLISTPTVANARRVLSIPDCRLCAWSRLFLRKFSTEALLVGCDARACLIALGVLLKWEISKQECRHGQLRRFCLASESWLPLLHQLSAQFLLMRHRLLERVLKPKAPACSTSGSRTKRWSGGAVRKRKGKTGKKSRSEDWWWGSPTSFSLGFFARTPASCQQAWSQHAFPRSKRRLQRLSCSRGGSAAWQGAPQRQGWYC